MFGVSAHALYDYWYTGTLSAFVRRARLQGRTLPDSDGWYPVTHAVDASTYSCRAYYAAKHLICQHAKNGEHWILNQKTQGKRPHGWSMLHMACDGSDKLYERHELVTLLLQHGAEVNSTTPNGQTPYMLVSSGGCVQCAHVLDQWRANVTSCPSGMPGALQRAVCSSTQMANYMKQKHPSLSLVPWEESVREQSRAGRRSHMKQIRHAMYEPRVHGHFMNQKAPRCQEFPGTPYYDRK